MKFVMELPSGISGMADILQSNGFDAYLVGGCVRDTLMEITPHDYDIATNARPEEIIALFGEKNCTWYGRAFGTVCVHRDNDKAEITTFRTEDAYSDSRHPDSVAFADDVHDDLSRRDFTCNAIAYDPRTGLLDPFHGAEDLKNGVLRAVGIAGQRFSEDALRILRGLRFYARFGLLPECATDAAMREHAPELANISVERVFTELCGMLTGEHITRVLLAYPDILAVWIPEITPCVGFDQKSRWHDFTVWEHIARTVGNIPPDLTLRLAMLFHDIAKPDCFTMDLRGGHFKGHAQKSAEKADAILKRLRCNNRTKAQVVQLVELHRGVPKRMSTCRRLLGELGEEQFWRLIQVMEADRVSKWRDRADSRERIDLMEDCLNGHMTRGLCCGISDLELDGTDLKALGCEGRAIGEVLHTVLEEVIHDRLENTHDALLAYAASVCGK